VQIYGKIQRDIMEDNCRLANLVLQVIRVLHVPVTATQIIRIMDMSLGMRFKKAEIDPILVDAVGIGFLRKNNNKYECVNIRLDYCDPSRQSLLQELGIDKIKAEP